MRHPRTVLPDLYPAVPAILAGDELWDLVTNG
jgi:hypothetical protein